MAVTVAQLAVALRIDADGANLESSVEALLLRMLGTGTSLAAQTAGGAPDDVKDQAVVLFCQYLYDQPPSPEGELFADAWRFSGAESIVQPWFGYSTDALRGPAAAFDAIAALRTENAPAAVLAEAKSRYTNYIKATPTNGNVSGAWVLSGAAGYLSPWTPRAFADPVA